MFADARQLAEGEVLSADVCIAGAGAAGVTIARDLVGSGLRVILLESGGHEPDAATQALYAGTRTGVAELFPGQQLDGCRLRYFGGSTNHWTGLCRRISPDVFDDRPGVTDGWLIDAAALDPYYERAHRTCGIGADEFAAEPLAARLGAALWPLDRERVEQIVYHVSAPVRFGEAYGEELAEAANVTTYLHANVTGVRLAADGRRVRGFACATLAGVRFEVRARHHVLALGGIENPRVLLASTAEAPRGVGNAYDLVGRYFMEHPHLYGGAVVVARAAIDASFYLQRSTVRTIDAEHPTGIDTAIAPAIALAPAVREAESLVALACTLQASDPDHLASRSDVLRLGGIAALLGADPRELAVYTLTLRAEQRPVRESRVTLSDERDPLGVPRATLDWHVADQDRDDMRRTLEILGAELARAGIGRLWMPLDLDAEGRYPAGGIIGGCHHMGTTRMSADPTRGVVDADCRVHGLENLFVAGSSVFPTAGFANPTLTIVALAHRLADHVRRVAA